MSGMTTILEGKGFKKVADIPVEGNLCISSWRREWHGDSVTYMLNMRVYPDGHADAQLSAYNPVNLAFTRLCKRENIKFVGTVDEIYYTADKLIRRFGYEPPREKAIVRIMSDNLGFSFEAYVGDKKIGDGILFDTNPDDIRTRVKGLLGERYDIAGFESVEPEIAPQRKDGYKGLVGALFAGGSNRQVAVSNLIANLKGDKDDGLVLALTALADISNGMKNPERAVLKICDINRRAMRLK